MIEQAQLDKIVQVVEKAGLSEALIVSLREYFPGVHFTYCLDDDIAAGKPVVSRDTFNIYLVDSSNHCSSLTSALESASGLVLAEVIND